MTLHELFKSDHAQLRKHVAEVQAALKQPEKLETAYATLYKAVRAHFRKEDEVYYPYVDVGKKIGDRDLMHTLRNDHAAVVFALESLAIRLRKKVPLPEWTAKFDTMINVLLSHFEQEEHKLFPEIERLLTAEEFKTLQEKVNALE